MTDLSVKGRRIPSFPVPREVRNDTVVHLIALGTVHSGATVSCAVGRGLGEVYAVVRRWVDLSIRQLILLEQVPPEVRVCSRVLPIFDSDPLGRVRIDSSDRVDCDHDPHAVPVFVGGVQDLHAPAVGKVPPRVFGIDCQIAFPLLVAGRISLCPMVQVEPYSIAIIINSIGVEGVLPRCAIVLTTDSERC